MLLVPVNSLVLVGFGVSIPSRRSRCPSEQPVQVWPLFVASGLIDGVTLRALGLEDLLTGLFIALGRLAEGCHGRGARRSTPNPKRSAPK